MASEGVIWRRSRPALPKNDPSRQQRGCACWVFLQPANPSFNRTCNGVPAQAVISFSACFVSLSQAG